MSDNRLVHYSAAVGAMIAGGSAQGEVRSIEPQFGQATEGSPGFYSLYPSLVDVDDDGEFDLSIEGYYNANDDDGYVTIRQYTSGVSYVAQTQVGYLYAWTAAEFLPGDEVGPGLDYGMSDYPDPYVMEVGGSNGFDFLDFVEERGFVGFYFYDAENNRVYACMQIKLSLTNGLSYHIQGGAYETQDDVAVECPDYADDIFIDRFSQE